MAWGRQNVQENETFFGLTADEVKAKLAAGEQSAAKVTELEGKITEQGTTLSAMQTTLGQIAEGLKPKEPTRNNNQEEIDMDDPEAVARARENFVISSGMEAKAFNVFQSVARRFKKDPKEAIIFENLEDEVLALLEKSPLQQRIIPEVVENAYKIIKANHMDEIVESRTSKRGKFYIETAVNQGSNIGDKTNLTPEQQLSPDELSACKKMGVSPENYVKQKANMNVMTGVNNG